MSATEGTPAEGVLSAPAEEALSAPAETDLAPSTRALLSAPVERI